MKAWTNVIQIVAIAGAVSAAIGIEGCAKLSIPVAVETQAERRTFAGVANEDRPGSGAMRAVVSGTSYAGRWVRISRKADEPLFGSAWNTRRPWNPLGLVTAEERASSVGDTMALLLSQNGRALHCILSRSAITPNFGECIDDTGLVYDVRFGTAVEEK